MTRSDVGAGSEVGEVEGVEDFKPLTREGAVTLRQRSPQLSLWRVVALQAFVAFAVAGLAWLLTDRLSVMWSAGYGGLAVVLPAVLFARALSRQAASEGGSAMLASFFVWELAKIGLTVAMLLLAPRLVMDLSWLALVAGFVVTMKVYWLAMWLRLASTSKVKKT